MRKKLFMLMMAVGISTVMLTSCGSSSSASAKSADSSPMYEEAMATAEAADYDSGFSSAVYNDEWEEAAEAPQAAKAAGSTAEGREESSEEPVAQSSRKLITNMNISAETENLDALVTTIENKTTSLGGYIENSSVYSSSAYSGSDPIKRQADITARIPAVKLKEFIAVLEGSSNITNRSTNVQDVTLEYVDTEAHKDALEAEYDSLLKLMDNAKTVEDIMAIETRLTDVRYELESIERRLRTYDNQVTFATVYINLSEVKTFTPQETAGVGERIVTGFTESLESVGEGLTDFFVFVVTHLPQILVFIVVVIIIVLIIRLLVLLIQRRAEKVREKKLKKMAERGNQYPAGFRQLQPGRPAGQMGQPVAQPVQPMTQPVQPVAQPGQQIMQTEQKTDQGVPPVQGIQPSEQTDNKNAAEEKG